MLSLSCINSIIIYPLMIKHVVQEAFYSLQFNYIFSCGSKSGGDMPNRPSSVGIFQRNYGDGMICISSVNR